MTEQEQTVLEIARSVEYWHSLRDGRGAVTQPEQLKRAVERLSDAVKRMREAREAETVVPATIAEPADPTSREMPIEPGPDLTHVAGCRLDSGHLSVCRDVDGRVLYRRARFTNLTES